MKAVVIFSGGQDSTVCLASAIKTFGEEEVVALTFRYGQKHSRAEIEAATLIAGLLGVKHEVVNLTEISSTLESDLIGKGNLDKNAKNEKGLPTSFVPNRNQLFYTLAHAYAQKVGATYLYIGANQVDYSGYPDCREKFLIGLEALTNAGSQSNIILMMPLIKLSKAEIFKMAEILGCLDLVLQMSHTCYMGNTSKNEWGQGCGECNACLIRKKGYKEYKDAQGSQG